MASWINLSWNLVGKPSIDPQRLHCDPTARPHQETDADAYANACVDLREPRLPRPISLIHLCCAWTRRERKRLLRLRRNARHMNIRVIRSTDLVNWERRRRGRRRAARTAVVGGGA
ncbi:MAG: hypothetical protein R2856_38085 [Caldilineaceae bacterium]